MSFGGPSVTGVPTPPRPMGVMPQYTGFQMPGGSQTAIPFSPGVLPTPGPSTFGSPPVGSGVGGVQGVSMSPVASVTPPQAGGGPHVLPPMPQIPLPEGFPNPFGIQHLHFAPQGSSGQAPMQPGTVTTTGPQGFLPGLGQFGTPAGGQAAPGGAQPAFALPPAPAFRMAQPAPQTWAQPGLQGGVPVGAQPGFQASAQPGPAAQQGAQSAQFGAYPGAADGAEMFWHHLAWQLLQAPAVKAALGGQADALTEGPDRLKVLECGIGCLRGNDLQQAFRDLTSGRMEQQGFISAFANRLADTLRGAGVLTPAAR